MALQAPPISATQMSPLLAQSASVPQLQGTQLQGTLVAVQRVNWVSAEPLVGSEEERRQSRQLAGDDRFAGVVVEAQLAVDEEEERAADAVEEWPPQVIAVQADVTRNVFQREPDVMQSGL